MPCKTRKRKRKNHANKTFNANQPLRLINDTTKAVVGIATLGIVANTVTKIAKP
jgi:hypothetical protein